MVLNKSKSYGAYILVEVVVIKQKNKQILESISDKCYKRKIVVQLR